LKNFGMKKVVFLNGEKMIKKDKIKFDKIVQTYSGCGVAKGYIFPKATYTNEEVAFIFNKIVGELKENHYNELREYLIGIGGQND